MAGQHSYCRVLLSLLRLLVQGANQAAAAAKLGYPTIFCGQVRLSAKTSLQQLLLSALTMSPRMMCTSRARHC